VDLSIAHPVLKVRLNPGPFPDTCPHTVLKIRQVLTGEIWILDTTGCQYGFRDVLLPMEQYLHDTTGQVIGDPKAYDAHETTDLDYFSTLPFMNQSQAQRQDRALERRARLHFAAFVDRRVGNGMLCGSEEDFEAKFSDFVENLRSHLAEFVVI